MARRGGRGAKPSRYNDEEDEPLAPVTQADIDAERTRKHRARVGVVLLSVVMAAVWITAVAVKALSNWNVGYYNLLDSCFDIGVIVVVQAILYSIAVMKDWFEVRNIVYTPCDGRGNKKNNSSSVGTPTSPNTTTSSSSVKKIKAKGADDEKKPLLAGGGESDDEDEEPQHSHVIINDNDVSAAKYETLGSECNVNNASSDERESEIQTVGVEGNVSASRLHLGNESESVEKKENAALNQNKEDERKKGVVTSADDNSSKEDSKEGVEAEKKATQHPLLEMTRYFCMWFITMYLSKLWAYRGWGKKEAVADSILFVTSMVYTCSIFYLLNKLIMESTSVEARRAKKSAKMLFKSVKSILMPYIFPYGIRNKFFVLFTWLAMGAGKACGVVSPLILGRIVTNLTNANSSSSTATEEEQKKTEMDTYYLIAVYIALSVAPRLFTEVQDILYVKVWQVAFTQVAEITFRHIHSLSLEWHLKKKLGNVMRSIDRGQQAADTLMYYTMVYLVPAITVAISSFVVFAVHFDQPELAAVCFFGFCSYGWVTYVVTVWRQKFRQEMNQHDNDMHDKASDSLVNFETVKYFTNEEHEIQQYIKSVWNYQKGGFKSQWSTSLLNISQNLTIQLSTFGTLFLAAYAIFHTQNGGGGAGEFVAVQQYVVTIFSPLSALGMIYNMIINGMVDIENLSELLAETPDIIDSHGAEDLSAMLSSAPRGAIRMASSSSPPAMNADKHTEQVSSVTIDAYRMDRGKAVVATNSTFNPNPIYPSKGISIEFEDVSFKYPSQKAGQGIHNISFKVAEGTTTALVGETGSGKTTISRLMFRFYDAQSGQVKVGGFPISDLTQKSVRRAIGIVPQDTVMFNDTIEMNIRYGRLNATEEEVIEAATKAQVHKFIEKLPKGYKTVVGERGLKLSGGEKQRVAIARCLLKDPPVVILDEATSALDNKTERELQAALKCLSGRTTIIVAHRLTTISHAEQIIVMRDGRIQERGTHTDLLAIPDGYYAEMWNMQRRQDEGVTPEEPITTPTTAEE